MRLAILAGSLLALVAVTGARAQDPTPAPEKQKKQANLIAAWEIAEVREHVRDAYRLVDLLHPRWLVARARIGTTAVPSWGQGPGVLVDGVARGGTSELRAIPIDAVKEIRYLNGTDAVNRYGLEYQAGAIEVVAK